MAQSQVYLQGNNLLLDDLAEGDPAFAGQEKFDSGRFRRRDNAGVYDPRTVWQAPHETADSLSHFIDDWVGGPATCVITGGAFVSQRTYYQDAAKTKLLATVAYTRNAMQQCTRRVIQVYAADGVTVAGTSTDTYTFDGTGVFPTGFSRA